MNQILAPCSGEFCVFNPLRPSDTSPKSDWGSSDLGEAGWGQEVAMTTDGTTSTPKRLGGLNLLSFETR